MVEYKTYELDTLFQALADRTRRGMLALLEQGPSTVSDMAAPFDMSLAAASKHIRKLEAAGLIEREIKGRVHTCRLSPARLKAASDWLRRYERFWNERLDVLEEALQADTGDLPEPANDKEGMDHANDE